MSRKLTIGLAMVVVLVLCGSVSAALAAPTVTLDGEPLPLSPAPVIRAGTLMVPARPTCEALGGTAEWDPATRTVTCHLGSVHVTATVGSREATFNTAELELDAAPFVEDGCLYVPLRLLTDAARATIDWDAAARTADVLMPSEEGEELLYDLPTDFGYEDEEYADMMGDMWSSGYMALYANEELPGLAAAFTWRYYQALQEQGFTQQQALAIVSRGSALVGLAQ